MTAAGVARQEQDGEGWLGRPGAGSGRDGILGGGGGGGGAIAVVVVVVVRIVVHCVIGGVLIVVVIVVGKDLRSGRIRRWFVRYYWYRNR